MSVISDTFDFESRSPHSSSEHNISEVEASGSLFSSGETLDTDAGCNGGFSVYGAQFCSTAPIELDVPALTTLQPDEDAPVLLLPASSFCESKPVGRHQHQPQQPQPLFWLQAKGSGSSKVKGRLRDQTGAFVASFDHTPNCPAGSAFRLFSGGRCHSSFRMGGLKSSVLRGESCIKVQLRGLPYVGIVITGTFEAQTFKIQQHMPGRRSERLLASTAPSPTTPGATRVRIGAGTDAAFVVTLVAATLEAAGRGGSSGFSCGNLALDGAAAALDAAAAAQRKNAAAPWSPVSSGGPCSPQAAAAGSSQVLSHHEQLRLAVQQASRAAAAAAAAPRGGPAPTLQQRPVVLPQQPWQSVPQQLQVLEPMGMTQHSGPLFGAQSPWGPAPQIVSPAAANNTTAGLSQARIPMLNDPHHQQQQHQLPQQQHQLPQRLSSMELPHAAGASPLMAHIHQLQAVRALQFEEEALLQQEMQLLQLRRGQQAAGGRSAPLFGAAAAVQQVAGMAGVLQQQQWMPQCASVVPMMRGRNGANIWAVQPAAAGSAEGSFWTM